VDRRKKTPREVGDLGCDPLKSPSSMEVLRKAIIRTWLLPHLNTGTRGPACQADLLEVVETILHKLKTCCPWR
jgi:hypothetical protein